MIGRLRVVAIRGGLGPGTLHRLTLDRRHGSRCVAGGTGNLDLDDLRFVAGQVGPRRRGQPTTARGELCSRRWRSAILVPCLSDAAIARAVGTDNTNEITDQLLLVRVTGTAEVEVDERRARPQAAQGEFPAARVERATIQDAGIGHLKLNERFAQPQEPHLADAEVGQFFRLAAHGDEPVAHSAGRLTRVVPGEARRRVRR